MIRNVCDETDAAGDTEARSAADAVDTDNSYLSEASAYSSEADAAAALLQTSAAASHDEEEEEEIANSEARNIEIEETKDIVAVWCV